jgi:putative peptide zinc metalloprotease protein
VKGAPASAAWQQVARLRPHLRAHLRVHVHTYRGQPWYVVEDPVANRFHRFDGSAYALIRMLDGERSVEEAARAASAMGSDSAQAETITLMARLHAADLLASGLPPSTEALLTRVEGAAKARRQRGMLSPLSLRVPLMDPDHLLTRTLPLVRGLYSMPGLVVWMLLVLSGALLAVEHWQALSLHFETRALDPRNLALIWVLYPVVKVMHELGHGYAVKRWGGAVHEVGVVLLVFTPVPYVDATASTAFADKRRRMLVAGAGIMVELALGAVAMLAWLHLAPGLARDIAFNVMLIGAGSTLLFNGNPLLRFDGYHVLADALEIPNLGSRSSRYLMYLGQRYLLGVADAASPVTAPGERAWLVSYGIAAAVYRTAVLFAIAIYVAGRMFFIGVVLAVWVLAAQLLLPLVRLVSFLASSGRARGRRLRGVAVSAGVTGVTAGLLLLVPVGAATHAEGIVQAPDGSEVRAGTEGIVVEVRVLDGQGVREGDALLVLEDPLLVAEVRRLEWRVREIERLHTRATLVERVKGQVLEGERRQAQADLDDARARLSRLVVRSPASGTVRITTPGDLPGRFVSQGDLIALVVRPGDAVARVVVPQDDAARVRAESAQVAVRLASLPGVTLPAQLVREIPAATDRLPFRSLGSLGGGRIHVDSRDDSGLRTLDRVFQFEIALPGSALAYRPGTRVHVRFRHLARPLANQWYRQVRQLFLARFAV